MNKKEIAEIRKQMSVESSVITKSALCYVSIENGPLDISVRNFLMLDEEISLKYAALAKKGLSGQLGKNLYELESLDNRDAASPELRTVLERKDEDSIAAACQLICDHFVSETDFCILFLFGVYDVPNSTRAGDEFLGSDCIYEFLQCLILPVKMTKPGLSYDLQEHDIRTKELLHEIDAPAYAFLYPAFTYRAADPDHVLYYSKKPKVKPDELFNSFVLTGFPSSPEAHRNAFASILQAGFGEQVPFSALQNIYSAINETAEESEDLTSTLAISPEQVVDIAKREADDEGVEFDIEGAKQAAEESEIKKIVVNNILPSSFTVQTEETVIKVPKENLFRIQRKIIDNVDYYMIPAANSTLEDVSTIIVKK